MVSLRVALLLGAIMAASAIRAEDDKVTDSLGAVESDHHAQEELEVATEVKKFIAMMNERTRKIGKLEIWGIASCPFYQGAVQIAEYLKNKNLVDEVVTDGKWGYAHCGTVSSRCNGYMEWLDDNRKNGGFEQYKGTKVEDKEATEWATSPFVVVDGKFIGGYNDLLSLAQKL